MMTDTEKVKLEFYFDPSCPFCWVTSRWLLMVSNQRPLEITWRPFSLAIKNEELTKAADEQPHMSAHRVLRVMLAASDKGTDLLKLYSTFGIKHFLSGNEYSDDVIRDVLKQLSLDPDLLQAADDTKWDESLSQPIGEAVKTVGSDIGVPTIVFDLNGQRRGYFGPVLQSLPDIEEAVELWDGLSKLAKSTHFYELKRGRDSAGPDVYSTAKC